MWAALLMLSSAYPLALTAEASATYGPNRGCTCLPAWRLHAGRRIDGEDAPGGRRRFVWPHHGVARVETPPQAAPVLERLKLCTLLLREPGRKL